MAIAVYSSKLKIELNKEQLERLYIKNVSCNLDSFRRFVHEDAECSVCSVTGAYYVSEGYSNITGNKVKHAYFSLKDKSWLYKQQVGFLVPSNYTVTY